MPSNPAVALMLPRVPFFFPLNHLDKSQLYLVMVEITKTSISEKKHMWLPIVQLCAEVNNVTFGLCCKLWNPPNFSCHFQL